MPAVKLNRLGFLARLYYLGLFITLPLTTVLSACKTQVDGNETTITRITPQSPGVSPEPNSGAGPDNNNGSGGIPPGSNYQVDLAWSANLESGVNQGGGGYVVYESRTSGADLSLATKTDVPYAGGPLAPIEKTIYFSDAGKVYFRIAAYTNYTGVYSESAPSAEIEFTITQAQEIK